MNIIFQRQKISDTSSWVLYFSYLTSFLDMIFLQYKGDVLFMAIVLQSHHPNSTNAL